MMSASYGGIAGVTFGSDCHRLATIPYLPRGVAAQPMTLLPHSIDPGAIACAVSPGANHAVSGRRAQLRDLVGDWLAETGI
jgi:hypothetical protein